MKGSNHKYTFEDEHGREENEGEDKQHDEPEKQPPRDNDVAPAYTTELPTNFHLLRRCYRRRWQLSNCRRNSVLCFVFSRQQKKEVKSLLLRLLLLVRPTRI